MEFILSPEIMIPFIISNAVSAWILWLTFRKPNVAEGVLSILFLGAGVVNTFIVFSNPSSYISFANTTFLPFYRKLILGFFLNNTVAIVSMIAAGQVMIGFSMLMENIRFRIGCVGGFIFSIAVAPLGAGSAFPSTLILAVAFLILFLKKEMVPSVS